MSTSETAFGIPDRLEDRHFAGVVSPTRHRSGTPRRLMTRPAPEMIGDPPGTMSRLIRRSRDLSARHATHVTFTSCTSLTLFIALG
jgi:hypothetical protein